MKDGLEEHQIELEELHLRKSEKEHKKVKSMCFSILKRVCNKNERNLMVVLKSSDKCTCNCLLGILRITVFSSQTYTYSSN